MLKPSRGIAKHGSALDKQGLNSYNVRLQSSGAAVPEGAGGPQPSRSGNSSVVERYLAKVDVVGSSPISRSRESLPAVNTAG